MKYLRIRGSTFLLLLGHILLTHSQSPLKDQLSKERASIAGTSLGDLAFFAGGFEKGGNTTTRVDVYHRVTRTWTLAELSVPRRNPCSISVGQYVLFAGGTDAPDRRVDVYNYETKTWTNTKLDQVRLFFSAAAIGSYALFGGGYIYENQTLTPRVDVFNSSNRMWIQKELSEPRTLPAATSVGPYALFACGSTIVNGISNVVDLFHEETLQITTMTFPLGRVLMGATSIGSLAIFAGGRVNSTTFLSRVDMWNYKTNEWTVAELSYPRNQPPSASHGDYVFIGYGQSTKAGDPYNTSIIDVFHYKTNQWITVDLHISMTRYAAVAVGPYYMFAGGTGIDTRLFYSQVTIWQSCNSNSDCLDDGLFCTDSICSNGLCDYTLPHCRGNSQCNNTCSEGAKNCFSQLGTACDADWCSGKLCDGAGQCSYSKPQCIYDQSISSSCQQCNSVRHSCFELEGAVCLTKEGATGACDDSGHCLENHKDMTAGMVAGIVIGSIALLAIAGTITFFILQRRKGRVRNCNNIELNSTLSGIVIENQLGQGNFGEVYKGTWNGTTAVALKKLKDQNQLKDFQHEAALLKSLQHPNIVRYLGIYQTNEENILYIVTEYMPEGSLLTVIHRHRKEFSSSNLISFAAQAASGMAYLESKGIVHRDLSLRNLLASKKESNEQKYQVYVSDFGLSRVAEGGYYRSSDNQIPVKWSAPESIEYGFFTSKTDVWSFGILLWELFSGGKQPYAAMANSELLDKLNAGYRLSQPADCPDEIYQLMMDCWNQDPDKRPTFQEIFAVLSPRVKRPSFEDPLSTTEDFSVFYQ